MYAYSISVKSEVLATVEAHITNRVVILCSCEGDDSKSNAISIAEALNFREEFLMENDPVNTNSLFSIALWFGSWMERIPSKQDLETIKAEFGGKMVYGERIKTFVSDNELGRPPTEEESQKLVYFDFILEDGRGAEELEDDTYEIPNP